MADILPSTSHLEGTSADTIMPSTALRRNAFPGLANDPPVYRLPEEVLSEIFLLSMSPLDLSIWKSPVLAVNSWWRACAINTPRIWSCIMITSAAHSRKRLKSWLQRSGNGCPLHITVTHIGEFKAVEASWLNKTPNPGTRIRSLHLTPWIGLTANDAFPFPLHFDCSNLHSLDAMLPPEDAKDYTPTAKKLFGKHPPTNLRNLTLRSWDDRPVDPAGVRMSSLKSLVLVGQFSPSQVLGILARAPQLERLEWTIPRFHRSPSPNDLNPIILPALCRLVLASDSMLANLLGRIETPTLRQLSIVGLWANSRLHSPLSFAMTCKELTHLAIYEFAQKLPSAENVASLLHALPNLEYLDPQWCDGNLEGLLALCGEFPNYAAENPSQWACPNLSRLSLPLSTQNPHGVASREQLARCLGRVLDVRCQPSSTSVEIGRSRLSLVVDIDTETMVSIVGEKWLACGGEYAKSLKFPQALQP